MARETKVGLLLGLALILLVGIILSDLTQPAEQPDEAVTRFADGAQEGIFGRDPFAGQPAYDTRYERAAPAAAPPPLAAAAPAQGFAPRSAPAEAAPPPSLPSPPSAFRVAELPASEPAPVPLDPRPASTDFVHYVQPGQSLADIAESFYGNAAYARVLARFNLDALDRDGEARPGARLDVPSLGAISEMKVDEPRHADHAVRVDVGTPELPELPARLRPGAQAAAKTVAVKPGDTLSGLAAEHLGSAGRWKELLAANGDKLSAPDQLRAGMTLKLPDAVDAPRSAEGTGADGNDAHRTYTVKAGDNLTRIARTELGDAGRWREVLEANRGLLGDADAIVVGMTLRLPGKPVQAPPRPAPPRTYQVRSGDSLFTIAAAKLGDGERWREVMAANVDRLDRPEDLQAGMELKLP